MKNKTYSYILFLTALLIYMCVYLFANPTWMFLPIAISHLIFHFERVLNSHLYN